jgi:hypothetical protein
VPCRAAWTGRSLLDWAIVDLAPLTHVVELSGRPVKVHSAWFRVSNSEPTSYLGEYPIGTPVRGLQKK